MLTKSLDYLAKPLALGALLVLTGAAGCASTHVDASPATPPQTLEGSRFEVERNSFSKKVSFRDLEGPQTLTMKYKGIPIAWGSPINLLVDPDVYEKASHRVRYRFQHPVSGQPMVLLARAKSHHVASIPIPTEDSFPVIQLFDGPETRLWGTLRYDDSSPVLFSGEIEERQVEIEQVSTRSSLNQGILKHLLFPFPLSGDFVIRVDGQEAARFTQRRPHGVKSSYDLTLESGIDPATREDAVVAFVVFDLLRDFVYSTL